MMWLSKNLVKTLTSIVRCSQTLTAVSQTLWPPAALENGVRTSSTYKAYEKDPKMQKLINRKGAKTKKHWFKPHLGESLEVEPRKKKKGISHAHSVRLRQLSHVLYDKVTEIINTGELSQEILEKHVSITGLQMTKDMNGINIFWEADRNDWQEVEHLLSSHSGKLRSLLISYHVLGHIPHIVFVKDKSSSNLHQLTELFEKADYGPDYMRANTDDGLEQEQEEDLEITQENLKNLRLHDKNNDLSESKIHLHCGNIDDHFDYSQNLSRVDNDHGLKFKSEQMHSIHNDEDSVYSNNEYCSKGNGPAKGSKYETGINNDLHFRCDLYGLNRDEMMKKILAKKSNSRRNNAEKYEDMDSDKEVMLPLEMNINPTDIPTLVSPVLAKIKLQKKLVRKERRQHEKLLERDSVDL